MRDLIDAIAESLAAEVELADGWTIRKYDPIWRNPGDGKVLYVFVTRESRGGINTNGSREYGYEVALEYVESAAGVQTDVPGTSERDETAELQLLDTAQALQEWALAHDSVGPSTQQVAYRLDYQGTDYNPELRRELMVRYFRISLVAWTFRAYG